MTKLQKIRKNLISYVIAGALVASILIFVLYPFMCMLIRSLYIDGFFSFDNYINAFTKYKTQMINSLYVGIIVSVFTTILSMIVSIFISMRSKFLKEILTMIILLAFVSPPFVSSLSYLILYGRRGIISYGLFGLSINPYNKYGIILMQISSFAPLNIIYLISIIKKIDKNIINSAFDLGAKGYSVLNDVVIPFMRNGLLVVFVLTFVRSICDFATPTIVGGRYSTFSSEIYMQIVGFSNIDIAAAMNVMLMFPSIIIFMIYIKMMNKYENTAISRTNVISKLNLQKLGIEGVIINLISLLYLFIILIQYVAIFFYAVFKKANGVYVFTTEFIEKFYKYDFSSLIRSIVYALIVSFFSVFMTIIFGYIYRRRNKKNKLYDILNIIIMIPFMIPGTYFGLSYILAFNKAPLKLTGTAIIVITNIIYKQLPITFKMCEGAYAQIPVELENSCFDLGGQSFNVIKDVIIPKIKNILSSMVLYNFNGAMTTAGSILFLVTPGKNLAIFDLFDSIYIGEYHEACVFASVIIVVVVIFSLIMKLFERERVDVV